MDIAKTIIERTEAAIRGDSVTMGALFQWYRPRLYAHALRLCGNTPLAQDAVQETFISAFTHLSTLRDSSLFYPWLRKILWNHCLLLLRKEKSILNTKNSIKDALIQDSIELHFDKAANQQLLYQALNCLSVELRSCILLRYFSGFNTYGDIALILDIPVGTVRSRLSAAREQLTLLCTRSDDSSDEVFKQSGQWSAYYRHLWNNMYDEGPVRNELFEHFQKSMHVRFTSGKTGKGSLIVEREVNDDLKWGNRFNVEEVTSCGNISVIEGANSNTVEYPDRCPPSSVFVVFRGKEKIETLHIFDSPRQSKK